MPKTINVNRTGRYVRVQLAASQYLVLAEVKVWQATGSTSMATDGISSLTYENATNRITTSGFAYDAAGNQVRAVAPYGGSQKFQYDAANRLANVKTDTDQLIASYTYGYTNERLIADETGLRTYYAPGGVAEYIESGGSTTPSWSKSCIYLGGRLLATLQPNGSGGEYIQYHHPDRLGTRLVTNASDTNYFEQQTLPFGTALNEIPYSGATTGSTIRRFTSYDRSVTTGLDYALNRHYDPQQGRFTQVDPIGMRSVSLTTPQTLNLYAYCANDPVNFVDPAGLFFKKLFGWIGKLFKWTAKVFKVAFQAAAKLLANKWVRLALLIAITAFTGPGPLLLGFAETAGFTIKTFLILSSGILVASEAARRWQQQDKLPDCSTGQVPCEVGGVVVTNTRGSFLRNIVTGITVALLSAANAMAGLLGRRATRITISSSSEVPRQDFDPCRTVPHPELSALEIAKGEVVKAVGETPGVHPTTAIGKAGSRGLPVAGGMGDLAPPLFYYIQKRACEQQTIQDLCCSRKMACCTRQ